MRLGYARVSTTGQKLERQDYMIKQAYPDISDEHIFRDKISGTIYDRPSYEMLKRCLRNGDELVIAELDRLGRNKEMVLNELRYFKDNGIILRIIEIPMTLKDNDTKDRVERMEAIIQMYIWYAEKELEKLKNRQRTGIESAKAQGKYRGRKPMTLNAEEFRKVYTLWKSKQITGVEAMQKLKLTNSTFYRKVADYEEK